MIRLLFVEQADPNKNLTTGFPEFYCTILSRIGTVDMETSVSIMIIQRKFAIEKFLSKKFLFSPVSIRPKQSS
jgi:hypothetical protein